MVKRPTISDLALAAGVSVATVDRVLNGRLPVRADTARRVYEAAKLIDYHAAELIGRRVRPERPELRLGFLLLRPKDEFYRAFAAEIERAAAGTEHSRCEAAIEFAETLAPDEMVERLRRLAAKCKAVAVVSPDHPTLTAAVAELSEKGVPVFSLLSDFAAGVRAGYVGVDNLKVGRTAAWMIARCARRPGKVALFVGSHRFHGHELREMGFRAYFREHAPQFTVLETLVNQESFSATHEAVVGLLAEHSDLAGFYVAGGGSEGAISALRQARPDPLPVAICNEMTPDRRAALADGLVTMVINTPVAALSRALVDAMVAAAGAAHMSAGGQIILPFDLFVPESI
ncbi:LacI family DNA-binding transcriptional regulator [Mesorhizobium sp. SP-1A]|uniref:LacI family DNA-binding transcriptional regulator n=1 Tax=Mesorhizobium sp. SP-1A TaxID=3077840 RepID=UPI0028F6C909|nr:LacI family DNA-binding transcriptional regulator [Mesorhizobium sp. SP-1A]